MCANAKAAAAPVLESMSTYKHSGRVPTVSSNPTLTAYSAEEKERGKRKKEIREKMCSLSTDCSTLATMCVHAF